MISRSIPAIQSPSTGLAENALLLPVDEFDSDVAGSRYERNAHSAAVVDRALFKFSSELNQPGNIGIHIVSIEAKVLKTVVWIRIGRA